MRTDFVVFFGLLSKLRRVVFSDSNDDLTAGGGEFELWDELTGAVPHRHLPANSPETKGSGTDRHD